MIFISVRASFGGVERRFLALHDEGEVLRRAGAAHRLVRLDDDGPVHRTAVLLGIELAGVDAGGVDAVDAEQALDLAAGLLSLEDHRHLFALVHLGPGVADRQHLAGLEGHEGMGRRFHVGDAVLDVRDAPGTLELLVVDEVAEGLAQHELGSG